MAITSKNQRLISYKKLAGKAHTNPEFGTSNETYPSFIQLASSFVFAEEIEINSTAQEVVFELEQIPLSTYPGSDAYSFHTGDADGLGGGEKKQDGTHQQTAVHGFILKLQNEVTIGTTSYAAGTALHLHQKLQIIPESFGSVYKPKVYSSESILDSNLMAEDALQDWVLDCSSGILFMQDIYDGLYPLRAKAYIYTGKYLDEMVEEAASSGGGGATPAGSSGQIQFHDGQNPAGLAASNNLVWDNNANKLSVNGTIEITGPTSGESGLFVGDPQGGTWLIKSKNDSDEDTGIYSFEEDSISLITNNDARLTATNVGIGIGTVTPSQPLHVNGNIKSVGTIYALSANDNTNTNNIVIRRDFEQSGTNLAYTFSHRESGKELWLFSSDGLGSIANFVSFKHEGSTTKKITFPADGSLFEIDLLTGRTTTNGTSYIVPPTDDSALRLGRTGGYATIKATANHLIMDSNGIATALNYYVTDDIWLAHGGGNVGIGSITGPTEKLEVIGNVKATAFIGDGSQLTGISTGVSVAGSSGEIQFNDGSSGLGASADLYWNSTNDRLGIGTTTPSAKLHIEAGNSGETPTNIDGLFVENAGSNDAWFVFQTATAGGGKSFSITNAGNVGIGTTTPTQKLEVNGNALVASRLYVGQRIEASPGSYLTSPTSMQVGNFKIESDIVSTASGYITKFYNSSDLVYTFYDDLSNRYVQSNWNMRIENNIPTLLMKNTISSDGILSFYGKNPYDSNMGVTSQITVGEGSSSDIKFAIKTISYAGTLTDRYYIHNTNNSIEHVFDGNVKINGTLEATTTTSDSLILGDYNDITPESIGNLYIKCDSSGGGIHLREKDSSQTWNIFQASAGDSSGLSDSALYFRWDNDSKVYFDTAGSIVSQGGGQFANDLSVEKGTFTFNVYTSGLTNTLMNRTSHVFTNGNLSANYLYSYGLVCDNNAEIDSAVIGPKDAGSNVSVDTVASLRIERSDAHLQLISSNGGNYGSALVLTTGYENWFIHAVPTSTTTSVDGTTTNMRARNLEFRYKYQSSNADYIGSSALKAYIKHGGWDNSSLNFTGQHRSKSDTIDLNKKEQHLGLVVVSEGTYASVESNSITLNEALPKVSLASKRNQKSVFGVISDAEDETAETREYALGNFVSVSNKTVEDTRLIINSLGEGGIWVTNVNGNLENGDYITTCEIPGYGMKQDDDLLHNYTVAKITCDCDFNLESPIYICEEFEHEGTMYKRAFVGCTYHCG